MAATQVELRYHLLRAVSSYVNSKQPHLCKKVVLLVSQLGLAAEGDPRLSREENEVLSGGVDAFCDKVKEALARKNVDEEKVLGITQLSWVISNCYESRVAHSLEQWCDSLLNIVKQDHGSSLALSACGLISQLFDRLKAMAWVQGVRKLVAPLASKVLQTMVKNLVINGKESISWLAHGRAIVDIVGGFPVHHQHMESAIEAIVPRLVMESASDQQRLLSSEFLSAAVANSRDRRHWSAVIRQLLFLSHELLDHILGEWEIDAQGPADRSTLALKGGEGTCAGIRALNSTHIDKQSIASAIKVFGGIWDALERLITLEMEDVLPLPSHHFFSLISRLLSVDHSTVQRSFKSTPNSLLLFGHLAPLHEAAWDMLALLVDLAGSQILTLSESIDCLLKQQLRRLCAGSSTGKMGMEGHVRAKMYHAAQRCIEQQGTSAVQVLMPDVVALFDLEFSHLLHPPKVVESIVGGSDRQKGSKRKSRGAGGADLLAIDVDLAIGRQSQSKDPKTPKYQYHSIAASDTNAQMQAMDLVGATLCAGGASVPKEERHQIEKAIQRVVQQVVEHEALAMAAIKLLLASVLAPCGHRPRLLSLATKIITEGCHHPILQVRELCHKATDELGSLIHPRSALLDTVDAQKVGVGDTCQVRDFMAIQLPHMAPQTITKIAGNLDPAMTEQDKGFTEKSTLSLADDVLMEEQSIADSRSKLISPHVAVSPHENVDIVAPDHSKNDNGNIGGPRAPPEKDAVSGIVSPLVDSTPKMPQFFLRNKFSLPVKPLQSQATVVAGDLLKPEKSLPLSPDNSLQQTAPVQMEQSTKQKKGQMPELGAPKAQIREQINLIDITSGSDSRECSDSEGPLPEIDSGGSDESSDL